MRNQRAFITHAQLHTFSFFLRSVKNFANHAIAKPSMLTVHKTTSTEVLDLLIPEIWCMIR